MVEKETTSPRKTEKTTSQYLEFSSTHVKVGVSNLSVSYEHGLGLLITWCGPQHVGVEPSQCLSVSYEHALVSRSPGVVHNM